MSTSSPPHASPTVAATRTDRVLLALLSVLVGVLLTAAPGEFGRSHAPRPGGQAGIVSVDPVPSPRPGTPPSPPTSAGVGHPAPGVRASTP